jgi:hypothetical protein
VPEKGDVTDFRLVKSANPFSRITEDTLRQKFHSPTMTHEHWSRFVCNLASRSERAAVGEAEWAAAEVDDEIPAGRADRRGPRRRLEARHDVGGAPVVA